MRLPGQVVGDEVPTICMRHLQIPARPVKIWAVSAPHTPLHLRGGRALLAGELHHDVDVLVEGGRVAAVGADLPTPAGARVVDVGGGVVAPGLVDLHVHALDGAGLVGGGAPDVPGLSLALAARGVTGFLATTVAAPLEELVRVLAGLPYEVTGARCLGVHLEGPWLAADRSGAQPKTALRAPEAGELAGLLAHGRPALLTLAPELAGADALISAALAAGVVVALGHSAATYEGAVRAIDAGARHITHCFNAMASLHHREPGLVGAALDRCEVTVEAIADGEHLHPAVVRLLWRACGPERVCLVSDAVDVELPGTAAARLADGTLAGSRIGLDAAVRNVVGWGIPLADALTMASTTPAGVLGLSHRIEAGAPADLVVLDGRLEVALTVVDGSVVWSR